MATHDAFKKRVQSYHSVFMSSGTELSLHAKCVLSDLAVLCHMNILHAGSTSFVANDPYTTAFNEGKRWVLTYMLSQLAIDIHQLYNLLSEELE